GRGGGLGWRGYRHAGHAGARLAGNPRRWEPLVSNQYQLMRERRFRPLFFTQFLGAFNDNVFKTALVTLVAFRAGQLTQLDPHMLATLLPGLFILPYFLFSATSGQLADKLEKSRIARAVKIFEIAVMSLAAWG